MAIDLDAPIQLVPCGEPGDLDALSGGAHICPDRMRLAVTECLGTEPGAPCPFCSGITPRIYDCAFDSDWVYPACTGSEGPSWDMLVTVLAGNMITPQALQQSTNPCWWEVLDPTIHIRHVMYPSTGGVCEGTPNPPQDTEGVMFTLALMRTYWFLQVYTGLGMLVYATLGFDGNCDQVLTFTNELLGTNHGKRIRYTPRVS